MTDFDIVFDSFHLVEDVGYIEKSGFLQADVDEGGLHAGQNPDDPATIDVADDAELTIAFDIELGNMTALQERNPRLMGRSINDQFFGHDMSPSKV